MSIFQFFWPFVDSLISLNNKGSSYVRLPVRALLTPVQPSCPSLDPAGTDVVCSLVPAPPSVSTLQPLSPTSTVLQQQHSVMLSINSLPSRPPSSHPSAPPSSGGPDLQLKQRDPSRSLELCDSHYEEMELRVTAEERWSHSSSRWKDDQFRRSASCRFHRSGSLWLAAGPTNEELRLMSIKQPEPTVLHIDLHFRAQWFTD